MSELKCDHPQESEQTRAKRPWLELYVKLYDLSQYQAAKFGDMRDFESVYGKELTRGLESTLPGYISLKREIEKVASELLITPPRAPELIRADIEDVEMKLANIEQRIFQLPNLEGSNWLYEYCERIDTCTKDRALERGMRSMLDMLKKELNMSMESSLCQNGHDDGLP